MTHEHRAANGAYPSGRPTRLAPGARVVLKVGSSSLNRPDGGLDLNRIDILAGLISRMRKRGHDVVLVSSGAVASGIVPLGLTGRPTELRLLQAAASVGQGNLVARWQTAMSAYGVVTAQVLLTVHDVAVRSHYRTVRATFDALLSLGAVPVVNENDAVATSEFSLGDNDHLAALVSHLVTADVLVLFTDVDGMWTARPGTPGAQPVRYVRNAGELATIDVSARGSALGRGGMRSKVQAATIACASGMSTIIASAEDAARLLGDTTIPEGRVLIDAGAARAVTVGKKSLLLPGVTGVDGDFESGSVVEVVGPAGPVARGICRYSTAELEEVIDARVNKRPIPDHVAPVVHRDDLAELPRTAG